MRFLALHLHMKACPLPCLKYTEINFAKSEPKR